MITPPTTPLTVGCFTYESTRALFESPPRELTAIPVFPNRVFSPERNRWVIGGLDAPAPPFAFTSHPVPDGLDVGPAPEDRSLGAMLADGEIDALFSANVPECVLDGSPRVRRLFGDAAEIETVERDHHRRTGLFPIMHTVCAPRALFDAPPSLALFVPELLDT